MDRLYSNNTTLTCLRGILALIVCIGHGWQTLISPQFGLLNWDHAILGISARLAVVAFFVLSGWSIYISVQSNIKKHDLFIPKEFALNRIFRILPPLIIAIGMTLILSYFTQSIKLDENIYTNFGLARDKFTYDINSVLLSIISFGFMGDLTGNINGPLWSLAIEMQLYSLVFLIGWLYRINQLISLIMIIALISVQFHNYITILGYLSFATGFLFSHLKNFRIKFAHTTPFALVLSLSAICLLFVHYNTNQEYLNKLSEKDSIHIQLLFALGFSLFLLSGIKISHKYLIVLGNASYTIYIIHFPIFLILSYIFYKYTALLNNIVIALLTCASSIIIVIIISLIIGKFIEQPKYQKQWIQKTYRKYMN